MKKIITAFLLILVANISIPACMSASFAAARTQILPDSSSKNSSASEKKSVQTDKRMFVYNGRLYIDTNETSTAPRCGVMDGKIKKTVSKGSIPVKELQSNFGKGYGFQLGTRKNRLEVNIKNKWHIFAYNENNLSGVSMKAVRCTKKSVTLSVTNTSSRNVLFGEDFILERKNAKTGEWSSVTPVIQSYAFHDIAHTAGNGTSVKWKTDWSWLYGKLKPGTYRIVKDFTDSSKKGETYTLSAKFRISK